jgi:carbamoyltransferase
MKKILGISAYYHDSAAALSVGGKIVAAAQEERFTRVKNTADFPVHAINYCLDFAGINIDELDAIVFYDKPLLKFERLLETYYAFAPKGIRSFLKAMPVWLNEKLFLKKLLYTELEQIGVYNKKKLTLLFTEHHLAHAASSFYTSGFTEAAILTIDGVGEWSTASMAIGDKHGIRILKEMHFPHSVGLLYSAFTYYLGFKVNSGEYKLMGLAPFGHADSENTRHYKQLIRENMVDVKTDGSIWLNQDYFTYSTGLRMVDDTLWEKLFGFPKRAPESAIEQQHCDLASAIQQITEDIVLNMAKEAQKLTGSARLCMAGGVALNCVANGKLLETGLFEDIYIQAAAGDAGGAIGAALAADRQYFMQPTPMHSAENLMQGTYLGPSYTKEQITEVLEAYQAQYTSYGNFETLSEKTAALLADGQIIGWFQGRMEFGPRALGNRSIIAYAGTEGMQEKINSRIKFREGFRPFAPAIRLMDLPTYFDMKTASPYMLFVGKIKEKFRMALPETYQVSGLWEQLKTPRSLFQSVTHVDFSARVQTVDQQTNPRFYNLIEKTAALTGQGMLVNTSFNVRGEPVVCSPEDAYRCFMQTDMDYLVLGDLLLDKSKQPAFNAHFKMQRPAPLKKPEKPEKSVYTIIIALLILYFVYEKEWMFDAALTVGLIHVLFSRAAGIIDRMWMRFAEMIGSFMPKVILGILFYLVLYPVSLLSKLFSKKDPLMLKNNKLSTFRDKNNISDAASFKNLW